MSVRTLLWAKDQVVVTSTVRMKAPTPGAKSVRVESPAVPSAQDKLILIGIGDEASEKTWDALIGTEDLAIFAMTTMRTVRESLARLERAGYIRVRPCNTENGSHGWNRVYLLSPDSPLVKGIIEVDWSEPEEIKRFEMRTFSRRDESAYVPSDSPRLKKTAGQSTPEPGSGDVGTRFRVRGNQVPGTGGNQVPGTGEPGSGYGGEPGSDHLFSTPRSSVPSIEREGSNDEAAPDQLQPTAEAVAVIDGLNFGAHIRPTVEQTAELASLVDQAVAGGRTFAEVRKHAQAKVNAARRPQEEGSAVGYLRGGLQPKYLPKPVGRPGTAPTDGGQTAPATPRERNAAWRAALEAAKPKSQRRQQSAVDA